MSGGGVYLLWLSDVHYYGGRTSDFSRRFRSHLRALQAKRHRNLHMQAVYNLHGRIELQVLSSITSEEERQKAEQEWLDLNVGREGCLNISRRADGGMMTGRKHSEETKAKFAARRFSEETREKWSQDRKGHTVSDDTRAKLSLALKGKRRPDVSERNIRRSGWNHTETAKTKISDAGSRTCSEATKAMISANHKAKGIRPPTRKSARTDPPLPEVP